MRGRAALILKRRNATGEVYPFLGPGFALRCRYCRWPGAWPLSPSHTLPLTLTYRLGGKFHCKAVDFFPAGFCIGAFPPQKHCKKDISTTKERQNIIIGSDHAYYAIKTRHCSFPAGLTCYGSHEPYTRQSVLEVDGQFYVCGTGRQPVRCDKTENDTYYLLTLAALAQEIKMRGAPNESSVKIAAGLPLTSFGRDKPKFRQYLLRSQPVLFRFEGTEYKIAVEDVALFPQGYAALLTDPDLLLDEPSLLLMDIGGWTVDLMRIDNARPVAETAHSLEFGMIRCIDAVREQVRRETGLSLTDAQIEQMLAGGPCALGDSVREIVRQQGRAYTERLFALVTEAGFDLRALPTVMLGGGAGIVQRHVGPKDGLCRAMFLPDDKVNAVGFERALAQLSGRVSEG